MTAWSSIVNADGRKATFATERSLFGDTLVTGVRFEHGLLALSAPGWQGAEQRVDVLNLIFIVLALLILVGGPLLVLVLWQARGRDPEVGLVADYLSEPPSDLRPGIAGALVDEKADMRDVVATVIDLARRGYIVIREESGDHIFTRTEKPLDGIRPYEKKIVDKFFGKNTERKLADLRYKFSSALPTINKAMYDELVHEKLVPVSPDKVRTNYGCWTFIAATIGFFMFFIPASLTGADTAVCLGLAFIPATIALAFAGRHMPVKTEKGALEAAKWDAFKSYLKDIERYTDLNEATDVFEQYLPYAIAFGLQNSWINKFSADQNNTRANLVWPDVLSETVQQRANTPLDRRRRWWLNALTRHNVWWTDRRLNQHVNRLDQDAQFNLIGDEEYATVIEQFRWRQLQWWIQRWWLFRWRRSRIWLRLPSPSPSQREGN